MLFKLLKRTWLYKLCDRLRNIIFDSFARIETRQANHDRALASIEQRQQNHDVALTSLSANDTSTLEALLHLVQRAPADNALAESRQAALLREIRERSDTTSELLAGIGRRLGRLANGEEHAALLGRIDGLERTLAARLEALDARLDALEVAFEAWRDPDQPVHPNGRPSGSQAEPELKLIAHLGGLLPKRVAVDIGANVGNYSQALLDAGFEVHAFEPNPAVLEKLQTRLGARKGFAAHGLALGSRDGKLPLHVLRDVSPQQSFVDVSELSTLGNHALPEGLEYAGSIEVPVRTLDSLHNQGLVPADVGYVKVDTEGFDVEVVLGMGSHRYPLISVEFWDKNLPFGRGGARNGLPDLAGELQRRGYGWWIVLYKVWGDNETLRFYCNVADTVDRSWGNAFFFQDPALFAEAERWCAAALPRSDLEASVRMKKENGAQAMLPEAHP